MLNNIILQINITAYIHLHFPVLYLLSIDAAWSLRDPTSMNGPTKRLCKLFFEQLSVREVCEILLSNREQSKIFK
jgi:hypothetical protein